MLTTDMVTETIVDLNSCRSSVTWIPTNLVEHVRWLATTVASIPPEHRNTATIHYDTSSYCDEPVVTVEITYQRPPTEEEISNHETNTRRIAKRIEYSERTQLAELKAKYES